MAYSCDIQFHRNPDTPGIEIYEANRSLHEFPLHSHDDIYVFSLMESGASYWNGIISDDCLVKPESMAVIPPGLVHSGMPFDGKCATYKTIYIDNTIISQAASDIMEENGITPEFKQIVMSDSKIIPHFKLLYDSINCNAEQLELESSIAAFLGSLISGFSTKKYRAQTLNGTNRAVKKAEALLSAELHHKISLADAAAEAGLSKYHFLRSFKRYTGVSPHVYRTQKRIETAKKMVLQGMPFSLIALETGFTDQSHFSNQFKHYTGTTPNQYLAG